MAATKTLAPVLYMQFSYALSSPVLRGWLHLLILMRTSILFLNMNKANQLLSLTCKWECLIYLTLMSKPSKIVDWELKMFFRVYKTRVSPVTLLGLVFLPRRSRSCKLPTVPKGTPQTMLAQKKRAVSSELYGLKSGCQSAVTAQWEWACSLGKAPMSSEPPTNYPLCAS